MAALPRVPHLSLNWHPAGDIVIARGRGCEVYDTDGRRYLDFMAGISVLNTGHCHPAVVEAIQKQAACLVHSQSYLALSPVLLQLAERLAALMPGALDTFFFCSTGSEAVEAAMRLARSATGRGNIIAFQGAFHGRTAGAMSLTTSNAQYRAGALPFVPGVFHAPYPRAFRHGISEDEATERCLRALREMLRTQTRPEHTAAIIIESVLGEGGIVPAPVSFLRRLRALCDEHGILLIADEIQSGFGRTGRMFAVEHAGVQPDIICLGKGIASGLPLAAIAAREAVMDKAPYGSQGGTYNGNAVACAAALATLHVIQNENLPQRAEEAGAYLKGLLEDLQAASGRALMGDVRGRGLMIGVEMMRPDGSAAAEETMALVARCRAKGLILLTSGPESNVVRWTPPLIVSREQIDEATAIFKSALGENNGS